MERILIVRLSAMGDIIHALPVASALRRAHPNAHIAWLIERRWLPLLEGNLNLNETIVLERGSAWAMAKSAMAIRDTFDTAYDLQGLLKSAIPTWLSARLIQGSAQPREGASRLFYTSRVDPKATHIVDQHMEIAGLANAPREFALPPGKPEGRLPDGDFVLASPAAGWVSKQWPKENYQQLRALLKTRNIALVLNGPPGSALDHESSIAGLIHATRKARAIVGVDSGPLHIAAALAKPGVAIFGPTSPARNGPYGGSIQVLRAANARTTYERGDEIDPSMQAITADQVFEALGSLDIWR